jgi:2-methylcitrate dehydratase
MTSTISATAVDLPRDTNQALGIGRFAADFMAGRLGEPAPAVLERTLQFFTDSMVCGISALSLGTNAPSVLRGEALDCAHPDGVPVLGSPERVLAEKAIAANCAAVREWDANGTNFGYNPAAGRTAGEFGHNDFYPVAVAAAQLAGRDGAFALRGMVLLDEIRGRLAEVFSLKSYKIDHVVHGAIGSAAAFGAMLGAAPEQIESAIGMFVAHYIPWRAIRAGEQLSDSKGASAALSAEAAVLAAQRSLRGFVGPRDVFRNPEAIFRAFEGPGQLFARVGAARPPDRAARHASPFDLTLAHSGSDFAVMGMHFKLGLYEHQSAGALAGLIGLIEKHPDLLASPDRIRSIRILAYEPAFSIIGDPHKRDPRTRQSADHSMLYIVATTLRKALDLASRHGPGAVGHGDEAWKNLMLAPEDYGRAAIVNPLTRALMDRITFEHGGAEYDRRYPDGIPTSVVITASAGGTLDSGLVMYPPGHARNASAGLDGLLANKWRRLAGPALAEPDRIIGRFSALPKLSPSQLAALYDFEIVAGEPVD